MNIENIVDQSLKIPAMLRDIRVALSGLQSAGYVPDFWRDVDLRNEFMGDPVLYDHFDTGLIEKVKETLTKVNNFDHLSKMQFNTIAELKHWEQCIYRAYEKLHLLNNQGQVVRSNIKSYTNATRDRGLLISGMNRVIEEIKDKVKIKRGKRGFLDRLDMKYRYRLMPESKWQSNFGSNDRRPALRLYFQIKNIWIDVMDRSQNEEMSYIIPYGSVDKEGKADGITVMFTIHFRKIARQLIAYMNAGQERRVRNISAENVLRSSGGVGSTGLVYGKHPKYRWGSINFPYIGSGGRGAQPCFGTLESNIWKSVFELDIKSLSMLLRTWATQYTYGATHPFQSISNLYRGIPKAYGELGKKIGTDTRVCESTWTDAYVWQNGGATRRVDAKREADTCDKIECQLRPSESNSNPCEQYRHWDRIRENIKGNTAKIANERVTT